MRGTGPFGYPIEIDPQDHHSWEFVNMADEFEFRRRIGLSQAQEARRLKLVGRAWIRSAGYCRHDGGKHARALAEARDCIRRAGLIGEQSRLNLTAYRRNALPLAAE